MKKTALVLLMVIVGAGMASCNKLGQSGGDGAAATVNGKKITYKEVDEAIASQMGRFEAQIYQIKKSGLDQLIEDQLIKDAAAKKGMAVEAFLEAEVMGKAPAPSEEELKAFYEVRKGQAGGKSYNEMKETIRNFLTEGRKRAAQESLIGELRKTAEVKVFLEAPRHEVPAGNSPAKGPTGAPVTVIEYSDYQCPFCGRARSTVNQILETYKDKVRYIFKDFPLSFHRDAAKAHEAAHCAGDQSKYWEYNDKLFANQQNLKVEDLKKYAGELKLDAKKFDECLDGGKYAKAVQDSIGEGSKYGVSGTPAFFINGISLSGARPFTDFQEIIDQELKK